MSEISHHIQEHSQQLYRLTKGFLDGADGKELVKSHQAIIASATPLEVILAFDAIMKEDYPIEAMKKAVNKVMNLLHKGLSDLIIPEPPSGSYLHTFVMNNALMAQKLNEIRPLIQPFNDNSDNETIRLQLINNLRALLKFKKQYLIKENILFPIIEKNLPEHLCLRVMWSFHNDITRNLEHLIEELSLSLPDVKKINQLLGLVFFNMMAIKFREEKVLFPVIMTYVPEQELEALLEESLALGFPYYTPQRSTLIVTEKVGQNGTIDVGAGAASIEHAQFSFGHLPADTTSPTSTEQDGKIDLGTGSLSIEQIKLIFNHLPVDITFVDEHDHVQFFSTPPNRIFPRSKAIIGRLVQNCHPHESIEVVNRIVASFKSGEKSQADFWIKMKGQMFLIQYFAVRDEQQQYRGVIEVSQKIDNIRALEGERRLLDW